MNPSRSLWLFVLSLFFHQAASGQAPFVEGVVVYSVSLNQANGQESLGQQAGTYTITVKGQQARKDLVMNSGFSNTVIFTVAGKDEQAYSLQQTPGQNYAIQMDPAALEDKLRKNRGYTVREEGNGRTIAGYSCRKARISYPDGSSGDLYYTNALRPANDHLFDRFPGIKVFPLYFEYRNEQGVFLKFQAEKVETQPVEAGQFRIPAGYKIMSSEEYRSLKN